MNNNMLLLAGLICILSACASTDEMSTEPATQNEFTQPERPLPYPVDLPPQFLQAIENGTRTTSGKPGENYWTQFTKYVIDAELIPQDTMLTATASITYYNNSPANLPIIIFELAQNLHAEGAIRNETVEVTGGTKIHSITVEGDTIPAARQLIAGLSGYQIQGTNLIVVPPAPVSSQDSVSLAIEYSFKIPQQGASGRMGYSGENMYHIAYWFPHAAVFDDLEGWFGDTFTGNSEFYHGFGDYEVNFTVPDSWIAMGTGELINPENNLSPSVLNRYNQAAESDTPVQIVTEKDYGNTTIPSDSGKNTWKFKAENVRDVAYSFVRNYNWDGARTPVGDLDSDGETDYTRIHSFWRNTAPLWQKEVEYAQHSIAFLSEFTGLSYPWPHMTSVEAAGIIGGGMEFPMITIMGSYNNRLPMSLYDVTAHELAHMWIPMIVSTNERRYAWIDEGSTTFNEANARWDYEPKTFDYLDEFSRYLRIAGSPAEGEIMRWSDYHYSGLSYGTASYPKPGSVLIALKGVVGDETFHKAWKTFISRWAYKHPTPYDLFNTFEDVAIRDLDWFWRSWYFETWTLDQAVKEVTQTEEEATIVVEDLGRIPMPVDLTVTFAEGSSIEYRIPVDEWLLGKRTTSLTIPVTSEVTQVVIDQKHYYPDTNRGNNSWSE